MSSYVPPHLRNSGTGASTGAVRNTNEFHDRDGRNNHARFNSRRSGRNDYSSGAARGSRGDNGGRWNNGNSGGGGGGYNATGGGANRWSAGDPARPGPRNAQIEKKLFGDSQNEENLVQQMGINFDAYDSIEVEVSGHDVPAPVVTFADLDVPDILAENIALAGYVKPTPVQKHACPIAIATRDLMSCAQTGSGKTAAFLFPMISRILKNESTLSSSGSVGRHGDGRRSAATPKGLILAPTRELCSQIFKESQKFTYRSGVRGMAVYGGGQFNMRTQLQELSRGVDFIVATPGRLVDFVERGRLSLERIQMMIFDEADRMLDMGFEPQIRTIVQHSGMPSEGRQTLMFSATFPRSIQGLASDFLTDYVFLSVGRVGAATDNITQQVRYARNGDDKMKELADILPDCNGLTLIFVETKRMADTLEGWLQDDGINATSIHGDRMQREREWALKQFKCGKCPVLVATDVASRGLDIPNVLHVINFDLPSNIDDYVHRIGRTGRCGNTGTAISLVTDKNSNILRDLLDCLKENNQDIPNWLKQMSSFSGRSGNGGNRARGGQHGGRDFRSQGGRGGGNGGGSRIGYGGSGFYGGGNQRGGSSSGGGGYGGGRSGGDAW